MVDLNSWLSAQGPTVRELALSIDVPLKITEDWLYRGVVPSPEDQAKLDDYVHAHCAHHWVIAVPNGPISKGECQRCGHVRGFQNSSPEIRWLHGNTENAVQGKSAA